MFDEINPFVSVVTVVALVTGLPAWDSHYHVLGGIRPQFGFLERIFPSVS